MESIEKNGLNQILAFQLQITFKCESVLKILIQNLTISLLRSLC